MIDKIKQARHVFGEKNEDKKWFYNK
jgi:hypothetical protein